MLPVRIDPMSMESTARWLHLSDLDCPQSSDAGWERAVQDTLTTWQGLRPPEGYDIILVSGNLTRTGHPDAFARASRLLDELRHRLGWAGRGAVVLAVPGVRDAQADARATGGVADAGVEATFANWRAWWPTQVDALPEHVTLREGSVPGDFSATIALADRGLRVGVVGINTMTGSEDTAAKAPVRLGERLRALCGEQPEVWVKHHHAAVMLAQRAPVDEAGQVAPWPELIAAGFQIMHCGPMSGTRRGRFEAPSKTEVVSSWSFSGYSPEGIGDLHRILPQGGVAVELALLHMAWAPQAVLNVIEHDTGAGAVRRSEEIAKKSWLSETVEELPADLPPPVARSVAAQEDDTRPLSKEEVSELLEAVLPEDADFRGFTFSELRDVHTELPRATNRATRTRRLLTLKEPAEVLEALRRYLPDTTTERLRLLRSASRR